MPKETLLRVQVRDYPHRQPLFASVNGRRILVPTDRPVSLPAEHVAALQAARIVLDLLPVDSQPAETAETAETTGEAAAKPKKARGKKKPAA